MKTPQSPAPVAGDEDTRPASEQPVEAIGAGREVTQRLREAVRLALEDADALERISEEADDNRWPDWSATMRQAAQRIKALAALSPASPARTPMGGPQVLKGVGKINGDGWKDTTTIGEVVYVWNAEKPSPYAPGQYPRIWNEGWSASTAQYDFSPASIDEVRALAAPTPMGESQEFRASLEASIRRAGGLTVLCRTAESRKKLIDLVCNEAAALAAPTPMGGEVEALREASKREEVARIVELAIVRHGVEETALEGTLLDADAIFQALAASSPSPAQGGIATWHPLDDNGMAEVRINGKRITTMPSYPGAEEVAQRINAALAASPQPAEDKLRDAISLILPLAKGYAAAHPVGSNQAYVDYVESFVSNEGDAISRPAAPSGGEKRAAIMREVKSYAACDDVGSAQWINALTSRLVEVTK